MINRLLVLISSLYLVLTPTFVYAASTKESWNNARNQEIRNTIGQNATYGNNSGRITVRNYDATKKMVEASLSRSATVNGSKASVEAAVKVPVNMGKVAATTAKRLARGGIAGMLGGAAVQLLLDGAGWVLDPANNSIRKPSSTCSGNNCEYLWRPQSFDVLLPSVISACQYQASHSSQTFISVTTTSNNQATCKVGWTDGTSTELKYFGQITVFRVKNPNYDKSAPKDTSPVSNDDLANELQKRADSGDPAAQQLIKDAYQAVDALGNATKDLGAAVDGLNDAVKDLTDAFDKIVKSDDPVATGNTDSVPTITTGGEASGDTDTQNKDKDGNDTGSSNSTSNFQLPAFCDWAAIVCDWYKDWKKTDEWVKDEPELKDDDLKIENEPVESYERRDYIKFGETCPFSPQAYSIPMGFVGSLDFEADATIFCTYGQQARPFIIGLGYVGSLIYLLYALRNGNA